jgi:hypothetical protein
MKKLGLLVLVVLALGLSGCAPLLNLIGLGDSAPTVSLSTSNYYPYSLQETQIYASASGGSGSYSYSWSVDGSSWGQTSPTFYYAGYAGTYSYVAHTISVTVTDSNNKSASSSITIYVYSYTGSYANLTYTNSTGYSIYYAYACDTGAYYTGSDMLGSGTISNGASATFYYLPPGMYNLYAFSSGHASRAHAYSVPVSSSSTITWVITSFNGSAQGPAPAQRNAQPSIAK